MLRLNYVQQSSKSQAPNTSHRMPSMMMSPALRQFLQAVAADPALQAQIGAMKDLAQLLQWAQVTGFAITARDLQLWAHDEAFAAPWWPWAEGGRAQHTAFFVASPVDNRQGTDLGHFDYNQR